MKIRTDFVTNSSSYCTTEIIIDNPVLLKILQKYKDMGLMGDNNPIFGIGVYESQDEQFTPDDYQDYTKTPAFFYCEKQNDEDFRCLFLVSYCPCPKTLDEVLKFIIYIIDCADKYLNGQICTKLKVELDQRKEEINSAYSSVLWKSSQSGDCEWYLEFKFDPINGSSFVDKDDDHVPTRDLC